MRLDERLTASRIGGGARRRGGGMSHVAFAFWVVAAVMALHLGNPAQNLHSSTPSTVASHDGFGLAADDQPDQPYADLRNAVRVLGMETRSLPTKSTPHFPGLDDPIGYAPCGTSCLAFGDAAQAPPAGDLPPAALAARAFHPRAPPSLLA